MRAVTCQNSTLSVVEVPDPRPAKGQLILNVLRCGICGSDLHARHHADQLHEACAAAGYLTAMKPEDTVVFGHEFVGEVAESRHGFKAGTRVVAMPLLQVNGAVQTTGLSPLAPGAYAEHVAVQAALAMAVPNGLPTEHAALTEPMAVALHAVRRGQVKKGQTAIVIGCGPVGLGVIAMLKAQGVKTVVASDYSAGRRAKALACGADIVVDPAQDSPWDAYDTRKYFTAAPDLFDLALTSMTQLRTVPMFPWHRVMRAAEQLGALPSGPVIFECVGVPGIIDHIISSAPIASRVVVVGVTMAPDTFRPSIAINKEIDLRFVLGYTPTEFADALHLLAEGKVDPTPFITGTVGLDGVEGAFEALRDPETHAKILVDPSL